jgi:hypothetical protein
VIPTLTDTKDGHRYVLRPIRYRDELVLADILRDRPDDGTGPYTSAFAKVHTREFQEQNDAFSGLPTEQPRARTWMLDVDGQTVGMVRVGYWFWHAQVLYVAVLPEERGKGHFTMIALMLRSQITERGIRSVSFEALASAPQVKAHAENRIEAAVTEQKTGLTGQLVTRYEFSAEHHAEILARKPTEALAPEAKVSDVDAKVVETDSIWPLRVQR